MLKSNKLYISTMNNKIRYLREENAKEYKRSLKIENMNKRNELLQEKNQKKKEENTERKRLEEEINKNKQIMLERLQAIMKSEGNYTKEEVNNYVFKGIKPQRKNKEEKNEENNNNNNEDDKMDEGKNNGNNAFITDLKQE